MSSGEGGDAEGWRDVKAYKVTQVTRREEQGRCCGGCRLDMLGCCSGLPVSSSMLECIRTCLESDAADAKKNSCRRIVKSKTFLPSELGRRKSEEGKSQAEDSENCACQH